MGKLIFSVGTALGVYLVLENNTRESTNFSFTDLFSGDNENLDNFRKILIAHIALTAFLFMEKFSK